MTRSEQRQIIFALAYEKTFHEEDVGEIVELAKQARELKTNAFIERSLEGMFDNIEKIDNLIEKNSIARKFNRIPKISLSIMRVAVYEILFEEDIPTSVSINEAVELAKVYGGDDAPAFVNGVLGAIVRELGL